MIHQEAWYREALHLDLQWREFQREFEREYGRGGMDPHKYRDWFILALRTGKLKDLPGEVFQQLTPDFVEGYLTLTPDMSLEEIRSVWELSLQLNGVAGVPLKMSGVPNGLTLEMVKKSEKAGVKIIASCWISSSGLAELGDGDWSLQYDGPVAPDLRTYDQSGRVNQYHDPSYQLRDRPDKLLARLKRLGWNYSEDRGVTFEREFESGRRSPLRRVISDWALDVRFREVLSLYFIELRVSAGGGLQTISPGTVPWNEWKKEVFGG